MKKNLQAAMREALRIQDRFVAEPLFAKTGRGYLNLNSMMKTADYADDTDIEEIAE